jgi:hypothetical protein
VPTVYYVNLLLEQKLFSQFNGLTPYVFGVVSVFNYLAILVLSYVEGNIGSALSYRWRTVGETVAALALIISLRLQFGIESIVVFMIVRSLVPVLGVINICLKQPGSFDSVNVKKCFELKSGIVMLLGYLSSHGLLNAVFWIFGGTLSAAFSQSYLIVSSMFSLCMGLLVYRQKEIKDQLLKSGGLGIGRIRIQSQLEIERLFKYSAGALIVVTLILKKSDVEFLKFDWQEAVGMSLVFWWTINHNVVAVIFRMTGNEKTFFVSVMNFVGVFAVVLISVFVNHYLLFIVFLSLVSYYVNKVLVDKLVLNEGYNT